MEEIIEQIIIDMFQWKKFPETINYETLEDYLDKGELEDLVEEDFYEIEFEEWGTVHCIIKRNYYNNPFAVLKWLD